MNSDDKTDGMKAESKSQQVRNGSDRDKSAHDYTDREKVDSIDPAKSVLTNQNS